MGTYTTNEKKRPLGLLEQHKGHNKRWHIKTNVMIITQAVRVDKREVTCFG